MANVTLSHSFYLIFLFQCCVTFTEAPGAPLDVKVTEVFSNQVTLRWAAPYGSNSVTKYVIQYWKHHSECTHKPIIQSTIIAIPLCQLRQFCTNRQMAQK